MSYELGGIMAMLVLLVTNADVLFFSRKMHPFSGLYEYKWLLGGIIVYFATDVFWGIFSRLKWTTAAYIDTVIYFLSMAAVILLWGRFVGKYLEVKGKAIYGFIAAEWLFAGAMVTLLIINFFQPVFFWFDGDCEYHAGVVRPYILIAQIVLFFLSGLYVLVRSSGSKAGARSRHRTVAAFGLSMVLFTVLQVFYPLMPMYALGCMLGTCVLHGFVIEQEKREFRAELKSAQEKEEIQKAEIGMARKLAYTDSLTGVKSKLAYMEDESRIDEQLGRGEVLDLAIVVFDMNGLKQVNDTKGHEEGNIQIKKASTLICDYYKHSPVYRVGGDEFVAILTGRDYENRESIAESFEKRMFDNMRDGEVIVASGMSELIPHQDYNLHLVFERADRRMYKNKQKLKKANES